VKGVFITFEGIDGCGKTTQAGRLVQAFHERGVRAVHTREPGGTELGREIRRLFLHFREAEIPPTAEALLMAADRADHVQRVILPALSRGEVVVSERFTDSTEAYQGYGGAVPLEVIRSVNQIAAGGLVPAVTFLLDIDPEVAARRRRTPSDRMEEKSVDFYVRVRQGYLEIHRRDPGRVVLIDASAPVEDVHRAVLSELQRRGLFEGEEGGGA